MKPNLTASIAADSAARSRPALVRAIGRWSLTAAIINGVVGSGIFGMPSAVAGLVGVWSPLAVLFAGGCVFVVALCFGEVGSRFEDAGGPYLYTREAFGRIVGFEVGWLHVWTRLLSGAAVLNVFAAYLGLLVPAVRTPSGRALAMTGAMTLATAINVKGVRQAAWTVNVFTVAKLLPLLLLVVFAGLHFRSEIYAAQAVASSRWTDAVLLLVFAYGGFESSVIAASETCEPKRDTAFALAVAIATIAAVYCLVQVVVLGVLPDTARDAAPVASALARLWGSAGSALGSAAAVVAAYGWLTGFALMTPRVLFSMAERRELPALLARVHSGFRTPYVAVICNSVVALALALSSSFTGAATLAAIARLGIYGLTCAALIVLRRRSTTSPGFTLRGGPLFALAGMTFSIWLLVTRSAAQAWILVGMVLAGALIWVWGNRWARI